MNKRKMSKKLKNTFKLAGLFLVLFIVTFYASFWITFNLGLTWYGIPTAIIFYLLNIFLLILLIDCLGDIGKIPKEERWK